MAAARGGTSGETSPWQPRLSRPPALLRQVAEETQAFQQGGHTDRPRTTASRPLAVAQLAAAGPREPQPRRCHHRRSRGSAPACCSSQAFPGCKTTDGGSGKAPEPVATMGPGSHPAVTSSRGGSGVQHPPGLSPHLLPAVLDGSTWLLRVDTGSVGSLAHLQPPLFPHGWATEGR